jgi:hypothetical protein
VDARQNVYFGRHVAWLKYFTYHLVPVLAPNCKQHILWPVKVRKISIHWLNFMSNLFEFSRVEGGVKLMKNFKGGSRSKSVGTSDVMQVQ